MISETDIVFVTTSSDDFLLEKQQKNLSEFFPNSDRILVREGSEWPYKWFDWIPLMKQRKEKYFIHLDIDFFITSKQEVLRSVHMLEENKYSLYGISDGYDAYRSGNPMALNSFYMVGNVSDLNELNFNPSILRLHEESDYLWKNNLNFYFKKEYLGRFIYPHRVSEKRKKEAKVYYDCNNEPYYILFWMMLNRNKTIGYLDSRFDDRFKSSNPRIDEHSEDIGIHMWYSRCWQTNLDVFGMNNKERYEKVLGHLQL
jgi:hypothetical protein